MPSSVRSASSRSWTCWRFSCGVPLSSIAPSIDATSAWPAKASRLPPRSVIFAVTDCPRVVLGSSANCTPVAAPPSRPRWVRASIFAGVASKRSAAFSATCGTKACICCATSTPAGCGARCGFSVGMYRPKVRLAGSSRSDATRCKSPSLTARTRSRSRNSRRQSPCATVSDRATPMRSGSLACCSQPLIHLVRARSSSAAVTGSLATDSNAASMAWRAASGSCPGASSAPKAMKPGSCSASVKA